MSVASDRVRSTVIEATEFPELSRAYQVMGVPEGRDQRSRPVRGRAARARVPGRRAPGGRNALSGAVAPRRGPALLFAYGTLMRGYALHRRARRAPRRSSARGPFAGACSTSGATPGSSTATGVCAARSIGWTTLNFSRCSTGRRGTISSVAARSSRSRTAGAREPGSTATAGPQNRAVPIPDGDYRRVRRGAPDELENVNGDDRR